LKLGVLYLSLKVYFITISDNFINPRQIGRPEFITAQEFMKGARKII